MLQQIKAFVHFLADSDCFFSFSFPDTKLRCHYREYSLSRSCSFLLSFLLRPDTFWKEEKKYDCKKVYARIRNSSEQCNSAHSLIESGILLTFPLSESMWPFLWTFCFCFYYYFVLCVSECMWGCFFSLHFYFRQLIITIPFKISTTKARKYCVRFFFSLRWALPRARFLLQL